MVNLLANKACQCYVGLCDWASVKEWQASVHALKQNSTNPLSINLRADFNYIQALSCFEEGDFTECGAQLELLPGEDYSSLSSSKDKLGEDITVLRSIHFSNELMNPVSETVFEGFPQHSV